MILIEWYRRVHLDPVELTLFKGLSTCPGFWINASIKFVQREFSCFICNNRGLCFEVIKLNHVRSRYNIKAGRDHHLINNISLLD